MCTHLTECLSRDIKIDKRWLIAESELNLNESIGKGEFGEVRLAVYNRHNVAVKIIRDSTEPAQKFLAEVAVMT